MIRFELTCDQGHGFEGWFSGNEDFDRQAERNLVSCPICDSTMVRKALMAPSVSTSKSRDSMKQVALNKAQSAAMRQLREAVRAIRDNSEDVGTRFPEEARKIHYGESEERGIIGQADKEEVRSLLEEGISIAPLPDLPEDKH